MIKAQSVQVVGLARGLRQLAALAAVLVGWATVGADSTAPAVTTESRARPGIVVLFNRPITVLRATVLDLGPAERARLAIARLRALTAQKPIGPVTAMPMEEGTAIKVGNEIAFMVTPGDLDRVTRESLEQAAATVVQRLHSACMAIEEQRRPAVIARALALSLLALLVAVAILWGLRRLERLLLPVVRQAADRGTQRFTGTGLAVVSYAAQRVTLPVRAAFWFLHAMVAYTCLTFCLGRFPYTLIWAQTMGGHLWAIVSGLAHAVVAWLPDLVVILIIVTATRLAVRLTHGIFDDIDQGRLQVTWCDPLTAKPTSRILTTILWLFALVMVYPYLPGSDSEAFKGVSVFVGLLVSLGASGVIGQVFGGCILMYTRTLEPGDFVRLGDDEGVVEEIGFLSTTIMTMKRERINVPNALLLSNSSKNYSSLAAHEGVITSTTVTIGYDAPWRQVHAMLQEAAARTPAVCGPPAPFVLQTALSDFYVEYQLNVFLKVPRERPRALSALHANILDVFNEYGVQIMSPNYEGNPPEKVWVPRERWYAAPAATPGQETEHAARVGRDVQAPPVPAAEQETSP